MTRTLTSGMQTAIEAERGTDILHLLELDSSGGTVRFTTAPHDIVWNSQTWTGIGGVLSIGEVTEQGDLNGSGASLELSGVDQTVISLILSNHVRGREAVVYLVHLDAGAIVSDPLELFRGYLNADLQIRENRDTESNRAGTVTISTRIASALDELGQVRVTRCNLHSHRDLLRRAGQASSYLDDEFFKYVPELVNRKIYWGTTQPFGYRPSDDATYDGRTGHRR